MNPKNLWNKTGFKESPYDTKTLKVLESDVELLMSTKKNKLTLDILLISG
jgi:hypothetical protein